MKNQNAALNKLIKHLVNQLKLYGPKSSLELGMEMFQKFNEKTVIEWAEINGLISEVASSRKDTVWRAN